MLLTVVHALILAFRTRRALAVENLDLCRWFRTYMSSQELFLVYARHDGHLHECTLGGRYGFW
jgi:hypothetical protein